MNAIRLDINIDTRCFVLKIFINGNYGKKKSEQAYKITMQKNPVAIRKKNLKIIINGRFIIFLGTLYHLIL